VTLDLDAINSHTLRQESLCVEIRAIDAQLRGAQREFGAPAEGSVFSAGQRHAADPAFVRRWQAIVEGLMAAQADLRDQCRVHSALLRKSRRSIKVLLNFLAHYSGRYPAPAFWGRASASET
jgi:hypothetical protein